MLEKTFKTNHKILHFLNEIQGRNIIDKKIKGQDRFNIRYQF